MRGHSAKSVFSIVLAALFILAVLDFGGNGVRVIEGFFDGFGGRIYTPGAGPDTPRQVGAVSLTQDAVGLTALTITNSRGRVELRGTEEPTVRVECRITVYADREEQAAAYLPRVTVLPDVRGGTLFLALEEPRIREAHIRDITVDYAVAVPAGLAVEVKDALGVIDAEGLANDLVLEGQNMRVAGVTGDVKVHARCGVLGMNGVSGDARVQGFYQSAFVRDVAGNLTLDIHLENAFLVENVAGDVNIEHSIGPRPVVITGVGGGLTGRNYHGGLDVRDVAGPVTLTVEYGGVNLENVRDSVRVTGRSTDIRVELDAGSSGYNVWAGVRNGDIVTGLPVAVTEPDPLRKEARGTVGDGRQQFWLQTEHANIYLRAR